MHGLEELADFNPVSKGEVYRNSKTKIFTDGTTNTICSRTAIFKDKDIHSEYMENKLYYAPIEIRKNKNNNKMDYGEPRNDSIKRAKDQIFDLVLNNEFEYFFTGTINPEMMDSKDPAEVIKPVQQWLKDMVKRYGLHYIMIAEYHKKGGIHFHGLLKSDKPLKMEYSGTKLYKGYKKPVSDEKAEKKGLYEGREVYNLKTWSFGYTTCIKLQGDRMNTAFYVTKYITKDCKKIFGRFFWHSRNLLKPRIVIQDMDFDSIQSYEVKGFKYEFKRGEQGNETK